GHPGRRGGGEVDSDWRAPGRIRRHTSKGCAISLSEFMQANRYAPIEDYGIIGDLHTVGLVGKNASIDFLCLPSFDSPSVFAALLDAERGGHFQIAPRLDDAVHRQLYLPDTNVLLTRFLSD